MAVISLPFPTPTPTTYPGLGHRRGRETRQAGHLQAMLPLFEVGQDQREHSDLSRLFRVLWDIVQGEVGADGLWLALCRGGSLRPVPRAAFGLHPGGVGTPLVEQVAQWVGRTGQPLPLTPGPWLDDQWQTTMKKAGLSAVMGLPLIDGARSWGAMIALRASPRPPFHGAELDFLYVLGRHAAIALWNWQMREEAKRSQLQMAQLRELSLAAQEGERHRICAELHDSVAQWMVAACQRLQAFSQDIQATPGAAQKLLEVEDMLEQSLRELRWVMSDLQPPAISELGLSLALFQLISQLNRSSGLHCHLELDGEVTGLPQTYQVAVYRIAQEALNNVRKHSRASQVTVCLHFNRAGVKGEVEDNGRGFDLAQSLASLGLAKNMGLKGMRERAEGLGGSLQIYSRTDKGTRVAFSLPLVDY